MIDKLMDIIRLVFNLKSAAVIFTSCCIFFLLPDRWKLAIGIKPINDQWLTTIGILLFFSFSYVFIESIIFVNKWISSKKIRRQQITRLYNLTIEEKEILLGYVENSTRTQFFAIMDGVVLGLAKEGFVEPAINASSQKGIPYNIKSWVWEELIKERNNIFSEKDIKDFNTSKLTPHDKSNKRVNPFWGL
jgi:hypothetical protein